MKTLGNGRIKLKQNAIPTINSSSQQTEIEKKQLILDSTKNDHLSHSMYGFEIIGEIHDEDCEHLEILEENFSFDNFRSGLLSQEVIDMFQDEESDNLIIEDPETNRQMFTNTVDNPKENTSLPHCKIKLSSRFITCLTKTLFIFSDPMLDRCSFVSDFESQEFIAEFQDEESDNLVTVTEIQEINKVNRELFTDNMDIQNFEPEESIVLDQNKCKSKFV